MLIKNKLVALGLLVCGAIMVPIDSDITGTIFLWIIAFGLLFTKKNYIL